MDFSLRSITNFLTWMHNSACVLHRQVSVLVQAVHSAALGVFENISTRKPVLRQTVQTLEQEVLALQEKLENPNPHHSQLSLQEAKERGFLPDKKIECQGAVYYLSRPYAIDYNKVVFALVVVDGKAFPRNFYFSRSHSVWRVLPEVVKISRDDGSKVLGHFGKGIAEIDTNLPIELQSALSAYLEKDVKHATFDDRASNVVHTAMLIQASFCPEYAAQVSRVPKSYDVHPPSLRATFSQFEPEDRPNFSKCESEYGTWSPLYGDLKAYVYHSFNKNYAFLIYEIADLATSTEMVDESIRQRMKGLAFIGSYEIIADNPITTYGNRKRFQKHEWIDLPLFEYRTQIPRLGEMVRAPIHHGLYACAWNVVRENPYIQEFYAAKGLPLPKPL